MRADKQELKIWENNTNSRNGASNAAAVGSYLYAFRFATWRAPCVIDFRYSSKGNVFFSDLRLKAFVHVAVWIRYYNKLILRGATVGGLHLPKVLKNTTHMFSQYNIYIGTFGYWDEAVHDMKSVVQKKDESVLKLCVEKLRLSGGKWNWLKGEKVV
jgi:hypothetical protein